MLDLVLVPDADGKGPSHAKGIVTRDLVTGEIRAWAGDAVILATGGYGNVFYLSTNAQGCNVTATYRAYKRGAAFANPCYTQIHPTCIPQHGEDQSKLTLMSESLRNDGRIWVPTAKNDPRKANDIPEKDRDYYLERRYPSFGNLVPRDIASRAAKERCDAGYGVGPGGKGVYLDFSKAIAEKGRAWIVDKYDNLFDMYAKITGEDPFVTPMRIYPAVHYTMGGLWVDYNLMSNIQGLHVLGEANFSDHGANRLGASALMQGLCDGYFVIPYTIGGYLASQTAAKVKDTHPAFAEAVSAVKARTQKFLAMKGSKSPRWFHKELGKIMWDRCGMARTAEGLASAIVDVRKLREQFWSDCKVLGDGMAVNPSLEMAGRVADFLEFGELMCLDALHRNESCGGHFREEYQEADGEAKRDDEHFQYVAGWLYRGDNHPPALAKEMLEFNTVHPSQRSYK
jgi:succinate dehydrogenase / fumarate reductase flavoprotein subunit